MGAEAIIQAIVLGSQALTALLNAVGASGAVSKIIGEHIAAGNDEWTDAEREVIRQALADAKAEAHAAVDAADPGGATIKP